MHRIIIIDDDIELCRIIKKCVETDGYQADMVHTGAGGLEKLEEIGTYQLVILDVMLPQISGFSILSQIRERSAVPVLMLTAKDSEDDKVTGLHLGADDYLTKPFGIKELLARVESLIRRYTTLNRSEGPVEAPLQFSGLRIDIENRAVIFGDHSVELTAKEFDLLYFLAAHQGRIFTKSQIYINVWSDEYAYDDSNIMAFISKLRKKIEPGQDGTKYIQTVRGIGYRFNPEV